MTPENTLLFASSSQHRLPLWVFGSNEESPYYSASWSSHSMLWTCISSFLIQPSGLYNPRVLIKKKKKSFLYRKESTGLVDQTLYILQINLFSGQPLASFWNMSSEPWNILLYDSHFVCLRLRPQFTSLILYANSGVLCECLPFLCDTRVWIAEESQVCVTDLQ